MIASFQRLGRIVEITARVPRIRSRAGLKLVVGNASRFRVSRVGQADNASLTVRQRAVGRKLSVFSNFSKMFGGVSGRCDRET